MLDTQPPHLRINSRENPLGLDDPHPVLSWRRGAAPAETWNVEVATDSTFSAESIVWTTTGPAEPETGITYDGPALQSCTRFWWRARPAEAAADWSETAWFETGILTPAEWRAQWITSPSTPKKDRRTLYFRREWDLPAPVVRGRAYASALGWYRLLVNDDDCTGHALVPRWTAFDKAVEYQVYDVTDAFRQGINVVGMVVSEGRYRGRLGALYRTDVYGDRLSGLVQIELDLADGSHVTVTTDGSWRVGRGQIRTSDPMSGERVDLRVANDWMLPGGRTLDEQPAVVSPERPGALIAEEVARVQAVERRSGTISRTPSGAQLIDFGQNFAGVARVRLNGPAGRTVVLSYSELLRADGEINTAYLGFNNARDPQSWFQRDEVILNGETTDYTPWFTIHGFRYVSISGLDGELSPEDVEGVVLSTDMRELSRFSTSDGRLEQLWRNVIWSTRSNFTDTPTDCPTRERSGWTGDIQVFAPTAAQLVDSDAFLRRYLRDLATDQLDDGRIPPYIPAEHVQGRGRNLLRFANTSVGWGDVSVLLPWTLWTYFGDRRALELAYPSAKAWVDQLETRARTKRRRYRRVGRRLDAAQERYVVDSGYHWGEWLRPDESPLKIIRDNVLGQPVVATAYFAHSARVLAKIATELDRADDAVHYDALADRVTTAWRAAFVRDRGARIGEDKQDEYVRALAFDLLPIEQRPRALARLIQLIENAGDHLATGFLSTPLLLHVLADGGRPDVAYRVLLQTTAPSWVGQIEAGATTIWETWTGKTKNGDDFLSRNHYAFGSVAAFLQERVAGLAPAAPGYRRIRIAPLIGGDLTRAAVTIDTPYGPATSAWEHDGGTVRLHVTVPTGAEADVELGELVQTLGPGDHHLDVPLSSIRTERSLPR